MIEKKLEKDKKNYNCIQVCVAFLGLKFKNVFKFLREFFEIKKNSSIRYKYFYFLSLISKTRHKIRCFLLKHKTFLLVGAIFIFFLGNNFISPILFKNYYKIYNRIEVALWEEEKIINPTDLNIEKKKFSIELSGVTGYSDNFEVYTISPTRYAINNFLQKRKKDKNEIEQEKKAKDKIVEPGINTFKTEILVADDRFIGFNTADIKLKKNNRWGKVNAILTCSDNNFDRDNNYCNHWEIFEGGFEDKKGFINFKTEHFSVYAGAYLEILTLQSNPTIGDTWEVIFNTYGKSDLEIEASEGTEFNRDLELLHFYCGDKEIDDVFDGDRVFINNYICDGQSSRLVNRVLTGGKHELKFIFGDTVAYARNLACDSIVESTCYINQDHSLGSGDSLINPDCGGSTCTDIEISSSASTSVEAFFDIQLDDGTITFKSTAEFYGNLRATSTEFIVESGAVINADGKGYAGSSAGGNGPGGGGASSGGAGYGGNGGNGTGTGLGGTQYGSIDELYLGSGGGGSSNAIGGNGGGKIDIFTYGTTTINADISADGIAGGTGSAGGCDTTYYAAGGGSGGSIKIQAATTTGTALLSADGGLGPTNSGTIGGGGSGGRIYLYYANSEDSFTKSAHGGNGYQPGAAGSIYEKSSTSTWSSLIFDNDKYNLSSAKNTLEYSGPALENIVCREGVNMDFSSIVVGSNLTIATTCLVSVVNSSSHKFGDLTIEAGGKLTHNDNSTSKQYTIDISLTGNLDIQAGGEIDVNYKGFDGGISTHITGWGSGGGGSGITTGEMYKGSGGGYGGDGGDAFCAYNQYVDGGSSYSSAFEPNDLGSGGGYGGYYENGTSYYNGGAGGGSIKLDVQGTSTINGYIKASGRAGQIYNSYQGGGGSGGSIWINTNGLTGTGEIISNGGNGGTIYQGYYSGGGSGGRIIVLATSTIDFSTSTQIIANGGGGTSGGDEGTALFIGKRNDNINDLFVIQAEDGKATVSSSQSFYNVEINNKSLTVNDGIEAHIYNGLTINSGSFINNGSTTLLNATNLSNATFSNNGTTTILNDIDLTNVTFNNNGTLLGGATSTFISSDINEYGGYPVNNINIVIENGSTLTMHTSEAQPAYYSNLAVKSGGAITHVNNSSSQQYVVNLNIAEDFTLESGGAINADNLGLDGGVSGFGGHSAYGIVGDEGSGAGSNGGGSGGGGGGGHGSLGGSSGGNGGKIYGDALVPVFVGSGGGYGDGSRDSRGGNGGNGGGAILLVVGDTATIGGYVSATGTIGITDYDGGGGGGSGGTIYVNTKNLVGDGSNYVVNVGGGKGGDGGSWGSCGGGGAGGRIVFYYETVSNFNLDIPSVDGGLDGDGRSAAAGGDGTFIYINTLDNDLNVIGYLKLYTNHSYRDVIFHDNSSLNIDSGITLDVERNFIGNSTASITVSGTLNLIVDESLDTFLNLYNYGAINMPYITSVSDITNFYNFSGAELNFSTTTGEVTFSASNISNEGTIDFSNASSTISTAITYTENGSITYPPDFQLTISGQTVNINNSIDLPQTTIFLNITDLVNNSTISVVDGEILTFVDVTSVTNSASAILELPSSYTLRGINSFSNEGSINNIDNFTIAATNFYQNGEFENSGSLDLTIGDGSNSTTFILQNTNFISALTLNNLTINDNAEITHQINSTGDQTYALNLNINNNLIINGSISADYKGYSSGNGSGHGNNGSGSAQLYTEGGGGGGAGHGGSGGDGADGRDYYGSPIWPGGDGGGTYDNFIQPSIAGSGGGNGGTGCHCSGGDGGAGGGLVILNVANTLLFNSGGSITADGQAGSKASCVDHAGGSGGGGSGGSIWIDANVISGQGSISANGGNGAAAATPSRYTGGGGGGGGGIIAIFATSTNNFDFSLPMVNYGSHGSGGNSSATDGTDGIYIFIDKNGGGNNDYLYSYSDITLNDNYSWYNIYIYNSKTLTVPDDYELTISSQLSGDGTGTLTNNGTTTLSSLTLAAGTFTNNNVIEGLASLTVNNSTFYASGTLPTSGFDLTIGNGGTVEFQNISSSSPQELSNLTIQNGGTLQHLANGETYTNSLSLNITGNANIQYGGKIDVSGKGYIGGVTATGSAPVGTDGGGGYNSVVGGGGAYGGDGGDGNNNGTIASGGSTYGSSTAPTDLGAGGGGGGGGRDGGSGGGAVKLNVTGILTVDGLILANGNDAEQAGGSSNQAGGGAGGSIWLIAGTFNGGGYLTANGGDGYIFDQEDYAGGGGGGGRIAVEATTDDFSGISATDSGEGYEWGFPGSLVGIPSKLYRSVGNITDSLNTDNATVTISGNTAIFSSGLPNNIGVGDVLEYSGSTLAFISSRTSSTTYAVQSWNGDFPTETTGASVNIYRPFQTLAGWSGHETTNVNTNIDSKNSVLVYKDLVASGTAMFVPCYNESGADTSTTTIDGWTTDATHYVKIYAPWSEREVGISQRHDGRWNSNRYRVSVTNDNGFTVRDDYVRIEGLQIILTVSASGNYNGIYFDNATTSSDLRASWNIITADISAAGSGTTTAIKASTTGITTYILNNIIYDIVGATSPERKYGVIAASDESYVYNNTLYNSYRGIMGTSTTIAMNNISQNCSDGYVGNFYSSSDYNISDISSDAPNSSFSGGEATVSFADDSNRDFHLNETDTAAKDQGTNEMNVVFTADIDGNNRSVWDIGADETPINIYRSIGPGRTTALVTSGGELDISGDTSLATFETALPSTVGVGDAIVYNSGADIAFIHKINSATEYEVETSNAIGGVPTATSGDTSWSIYRAYTSLANAENCTENTGIPETVRNFDNSVGGKDLISLGERVYLACYNDSVDTSAVTLDGWITGEYNYINIYAPYLSTQVSTKQTHTGKTGTGYRLAITDSSNALSVNEDYTRIEGIEVDNSSNTSSNPKAIVTNYGVRNYFSAVNTILHANADDTDTTYGIYDDNVNGYRYYYNNIIYDVNNGISIPASASANYVYLYNNTISDVSTGIAVDSSATNKYAVNNLVTNASTAYSGTYGSGSGYNLSSDATAPGTNSVISASVTFVDETADDFHLSPNDTAALDVGTSTPASNSVLALTSDADNDLRRQWDIGADEASQYYIITVGESSSDVTSLASWETNAQSDLTATTTAVFSISEYNGTIPYLATVIGQTSGAVASSTIVSSLSNQVLLYNIASSTFIAGEKVYIQGSSPASNYIILSNAGNPAIAVAKIDGTWSSADSATAISGWTTGEYNYIKIYTTTDARHIGSWDDTKYRISASGAVALQNDENYTVLEGLQIEQTGAYDAIYHNSTTGIKTSSCIIKTANDSAIGIDAAGQTTAKIWNNVVYGTAISKCFNLTGSTNGTIYLYNNTAYGDNDGDVCFETGDQDTVAINNIAQNCATGFNNTFYSTANYNLSGDETAPGSNSVHNAIVEFTDVAAGSFLMRPGSPAKDIGQDMSADTYISFTDDIEGEERYDLFWDMGADEAPSLIDLYRSVGNDMSDLNTDSAAITVDNITANFSVGLPDNVGIGDVLQYGMPLQLAFIHGRTSSTTFEVRSWNGLRPTATTSAPVSIYRAHLHLDDWEDHVVEDVNPSIDDSLDDYVVMYGQDLFASSTALTVACYSSTNADSLAVTIDGWTTTASSSIEIYTPTSVSQVGVSQRHNGTWDNSKYRLEIGGDGDAIAILDDDVIIKGLQIKATSTYDGISVDSVDDNSIVYLTHNIVKTTDNGDSFNGILLSDDSGTYYIYNNVIYGFSGPSNNGINITNGTAYIYNNTVAECLQGISQIAGTATIKNNAVFNNTGNDFNLNGTRTVEYNASDDNSGDYWVNISPDVSDETDGWKISFTNYSNRDFSVRWMHSLLYDVGTTISIVADDIQGNSRPHHDAYDIGAFEYSLDRPNYRFEGTIKMEGQVRFE